MLKKDITISVIMGVYNCGEYLDESIKSILKQTYTEWELIMCDDGSSDNTYETALSFVKQFPEKIKILKNERNLGLNYSLNRCLEIAQGKYIARMDGDDISYPKRFEKELAAFDNNPGVSIVSCGREYFDKNGIWGHCNVISSPKAEDFMYGTPFCHAPCMVKREAYEKVGGYTVDEKLLRVEDYHLWIKMYSAGYIGINIDEPLYAMRDDRDAYLRRKYKYRINEYRVRNYAASELNLPFKAQIFALKPLIIGLLPSGIYNKLHKKRMEKI